jgi:WD40 repeat protein
MVRWDPETGRKLEELPMEFFPGRHRFTMSADGKRIAVGRGQRCRISEEKLVDLREPEHHLPPLMEYLPDGRLRTVSKGERIFGRDLQVWDVRKGAVIESLRTHSWPSGIFVDWLVRTNPLGTVAAGIDHEAGGFVVYDQIRLEPLFALKLDGISTKEALSRNYRLHPSGNGQRLLLSGYQDGNLQTRWYDRDGKELGRYSTPQAKEEADNARWIDEAGTMFGYMLRDYRFALVDTSTKKVTAILGASSREEWVYAPAGFARLIVGTSGFGKVRTKIWDRQGRLLRDFSHRDDRGGLSPDGRTRGIWTYVKTEKWRAVKSVMLYETATGKLRGELPMLGHADEETGLSFSPDGKLLATAAPDMSVLLWDIARPLGGKPALPAPKNAAEAERLWEVLGDPNPLESDRALWTLVAAPDHALRLASDYLIPAVHPDPKRIQPLIVQLGAATVKERDAASRELLGVGEGVLPALRAALKESKSDDQRRRLELLIAQLQPRLEFPGAMASNLREIRMLEVLERIGTSPARKLMQTVAASEVAALKHEAELILDRW